MILHISDRPENLTDTADGELSLEMQVLHHLELFKRIWGKFIKVECF